MREDVQLLQTSLRIMLSDKAEVEARLSESKRLLEEVKQDRAQKEEAVYLARMTSRFPESKPTINSLELISQENAFLREKIVQLERAEIRKRTKAMLICQAVDELREELDQDLKQVIDDSMSISSSYISDISATT